MDELVETRRFSVNARTKESPSFNSHKFHLLLRQGSSIFRVRGTIYIFLIILLAAVIADYKIIIDILNIIIEAWAAHQVT